MALRKLMATGAIALLIILTGCGPHPPEVVEPKNATWRTFTIGGVDRGVLLQRVGGSIYSAQAKKLFYSPTFETLEREEDIETIILTPLDLGFRGFSYINGQWYGDHPTIREVFDPSRLYEWSVQNAERLDGRVVELLPPEAILHIRHQYRDQPEDEALWIIDSERHPCVFMIGYVDGKPGIATVWTGPRGVVYVNTPFVFRLRRIAQD